MGKQSIFATDGGCPKPVNEVRIFTMVNEQGNPSGDQYKRSWGHWCSFESVKP